MFARLLVLTAGAANRWRCSGFVASARKRPRVLWSTTHGAEGRVEAALREECGVVGGAVLVAMVSGGSDSVALLHLLQSVRDRWEPRLEIEVLHFDHGLRAESGSDAAFVQELCARLGVACQVHTWSGAPLTQTSSREWRRATATEALGERRGVVVLGHHADDQAETAVLRLCRGARLSHVFRGMEAYAAPFARPLLGFTKRELQEFLKAQGELWVEDASNLDSEKYARNKARLKVVPGLRDLARGEEPLGRRLANLARQSAALEKWTSRVADDHESRLLVNGGLKIREWPRVPEPVRLELLARLVARGGGTASYAALLDLDAFLHDDGTSKMWSRMLPGNVQLRFAGGVLRSCPAARRRRRRDDDDDEDAIPPDLVVSAADIDVVVPGSSSWRVRAARGAALTKLDVAAAQNTSNAVACLAGVPPGSRLRLRFRADGDRFHPSWRANPIKLKDFLRGQRVPQPDRDFVPLLVLDEEDDDDVVAVFLPRVAHVARPFEAAAAPDEELLWIEIEGF